MTRHYSEADLLETYYTEPGQSMPVMMHLAGCEECAGRYQRLDEKMRSAAACETEQPESFWAWQRGAIMRRVTNTARPGASVGRMLRVAAATVIVFSLSAAAIYENTERQSRSTAIALRPAGTAHANPASLEATPLAHDAWQSDELRDFHNVVAWESWVDPEGDSL